jgi:hypothetical protein
MHLPMPKQCVVYPYNVDLAKSFPEIFQDLRAAFGLGPTPLQIMHAERVPASRGSRCVNAVGHLDPDGKGTRELNWTLCTRTPDPIGRYPIQVTGFTVPHGATDLQRATAAAIASSFKMNIEAVDAQVAVQMAPILDAMRQNWEGQLQALTASSQKNGPDIRPVGANSAARSKAAEEVNDAQHAPWQNQDAFPPNREGLSNYLLDQTLIQDNNLYGSGAVGHGTTWNSTADALVKANPLRYEFVDNQDFWQGVDY